jgi:hypothetical protein
MSRLQLAALTISLTALAFGCETTGGGTGGSGGTGGATGGSGGTPSGSGGMPGGTGGTGGSGGGVAPDAGVAAGGNTGGGGEVECQTHHDCGSGQICEVGSCQNMYDRTYEVTIISAVISELKPDGNTWDGFGGLPDPYALFRVDGETEFQTSFLQDTRRPEWNEGDDVRFFASSEITIRLMDEDLAAPDTISTISLPDLGTIIKDGGYSGSTTAESVEELVFTIVPK